MKRRALVLGLLALSPVAMAEHIEKIYFTKPDGFKSFRVVVVPDPDDDKPKPPIRLEASPWQPNGVDPGTGNHVYQHRFTGENILVDPKTRNIKLPK